MVKKLLSSHIRRWETFDEEKQFHAIYVVRLRVQLEDGTKKNVYGSDSKGNWKFQTRAEAEYAQDYIRSTFA